MEIFINKGLTNGLNAYVLKNNGELYNNVCLYELYVVELLVKIYGNINIINPYVTRFENVFKNNLKIYGLDDREVDNFIKAFDSYEDWLNSKVGVKTDSVDIIQKTLVKMILLKSRENKLSQEELDFYDNYLLLSNKKIYNLLNVASNNIGKVVKFWERKKNIYLDSRSYEFKEIKPDYLSDTMYERHGLKVEQLESLSNYRVNEINDIIKNAEDRPSSKLNIFRVAITSGNGMVDSLILFSIVITEIFIGFLIAIVGR